MQPLVLALAAAIAQAGPPAASSSCAVADDTSYAFTREQPVQVGGGAMYVAARERRFLDALRGPGGEAVRHRRTGSLQGSDERTILDRYELTYEGLEKPAVLYLDAYHYDDEIRAPKGFTCALPIALAPPPPDVFLAMEDLVALAIEQGATRDFPPIPIDADGSSQHGVILDQFRFIARLSRSAAQSGSPLDPKQRPAEIARPKTIVVAFPAECGGRTIGPISVDLVTGAQATPLRRDGESLGGEALARLLPGLNVPNGALAATYLLEKPRPNDSVRIVYPDGACGTSNEITLPLRTTPAKPLQTPQPTLPANQHSTDRPVRLQGLIDFEGVARRLVFQGGPAALGQAAIEAVQAWTSEPARINGAPVITPVAFQVKFERR